MGRISRWRNAPGQITATVGPALLYGVYHWSWADDDGNILPAPISAWLREQFPAEQEWGNGVELVIDFESSGYSDPGGWDYPPEGDDEREVVDVTVYQQDIAMPVALHNDVWEHWEKAIYAEDVDKTPDYEEAERWDGLG
jgi:hypothetical protein